MGHCLPDRGYYLSSSVVPDVCGWIEVDGKPLKIFGATETENKVIGYVEANEGHQFVICYADRRLVRPQNDYAVELYVDGTYAKGIAHSRDHRRFVSPLGDSARFQTLTGRRVSDTTERPFLFGTLKTTDLDEEACTDEQVVKNLGTIQLRYFRAENIRPKTTPAIYQYAGTKAIHEKAKKAQLSHQASYGESVQIAKRPRSTCDFIDVKSSPYFQLEFRYRSRQLLQLEGHIPNSPTPSPEPVAEPALPASPHSPVASTSNSNRSASASRSSQTPQVEAGGDAAARRARLAAELEILRREQRIALLERELGELDRQIESSANGGGEASSSSARKIKAEPSEDQRDVKRVKQEIGEASLSQSSGSSKGKGKEKKKEDVIVLSDSD
ncbi:hypothetical protein JCM3765_001651 [Sporobolomyces pararoseus]